MPPIYAIGDIHGQKHMLDEALERVERDGGPEARVVFLGDYVDRGTESAGVIETLVQGIDAGRNWICLKGNHDRLFEYFVAPGGPRNDPHLLVGVHWLHEAVGGLDTLASYGVEVPDRIRQKELAANLRHAMPERHLRFLAGLKLTHREGDLFFVHAGIRPGVPLDEQEDEDLLWIRQEFHNDARDHGVFVVHGHTPVKSPDRRSNRLNLDTGAGYGRPLVPAVIDGGEIYALTANGRERIPE